MFINIKVVDMILILLVSSKCDEVPLIIFFWNTIKHSFYYSIAYLTI